MLEEVRNQLPDWLKDKSLCTLKKASCDDSKKEYMCNSKITVIDFDKIPKLYAKQKGIPSLPTSNDALYIDMDGNWYFIEFKNGSIDKSNIYRKLYDSLIMLLELGVITDLEFVRKQGHYILVYNSENDKVIPNSDGRNAHYSYIQSRSGVEKRLFDVDKFEKYLFQSTHTYTKTEFIDKFVNRMEKQEKLY